jgi:hypothetical protein
MSRHASKTPDAALAPVVTIDAAAAAATIAPIADPAPAPVKQPAAIDSRPAAPHPGSGSGSGAGHGAPRAISRPAAPKPDPAEIVMPDAGVGPIVEDVTTPPPPPRHVDRDQTLNPFAPKRSPSP